MNERKEKMITLKGYLVLDQRGIDRVTKKPPGLGYGEVSCGVSITLPAAVFSRPRLSVSVALDGPYEPNLSQEVRDDVDQLLTDAGFNVRIEAPETSDD